MINFEYYKVFYYVAKYSSITRAAEELFISQPAVSQIIKQLENSLEGNLFYRTSKGVHLTAEGKVLFTYISQGFEYMALGERKFKEFINFETGEIRIGASDMTLKYYLLPYLEEFHKLYPKVKVKVTNVPTPQTVEYLYAGKIDFGIVSQPVNDHKGIDVIPVTAIADIFVANNRFVELKDRTISLEELDKYPIICLENGTSTRKYVDEFLKNNEIVLNPEFELATSDLIVQFAERGLGIGCVVKNFAEELIENGQLFQLNLNKSIPKRNICIITQDKLPISPSGKKLLELLMP
ncbi:LysR family transcriptional regulator [Clostridium oryzae]|uniref:HTH-type transcriptional regulator CynR n=1 Tax=Clostridium oryzae TaxID=1450648 RepID=A0A1V4ISJ2_9CLOT|nr:LysR family transcriptional regulator [Clostridium oryzae]OPJ62873.1 HTH-type transcriptional regulator CynR [Clostridium oryzae]